ncbi:MAG: hypothetical protein GY708_05130 [Actinomycetia bacterium]|nr:hypothetical protein [Actinomycetes bacterium]MCP4959472.1 hypothetical protein [Actinomycetes bacterium]
MNIFDKAKGFLNKAVDQSKGAADDMRMRRDRGRLISQLGEAYYRSTKGETEAAAEVERLVANIDELDTAATEAVDEIEEEVEMDLTEVETAEAVEPDVDVKTS